jgi:hypothetical protein
MRSIPYALAITYLAFSTSHTVAAGATDPRGIALDDLDIVNLVDPHMSSIVNEIKSAYSSAASKLQPGLLSQVDAILPIETALVRESHASTKSEIHGAFLYGVVSISAGWIIFS